MSIFLLSNNEEKNLEAASYLKKMYGRDCTTYSLGDFQLIVNDCHRSSPHVHKHNDEGEIYGFGTFFNQHGFADDACNEETITQILEQDVNSIELYGHYSFVGKKGNDITLLNDPVGMMNVYYAKENGTLYISNNILIIAKLLKNNDLSEAGTFEFVLQESCIGQDTLFKNISRLPIGKSILLKKDHFSTHDIYDYKIERLSFIELCERIENYFSLLNKYPDTISCELSAGYDSRIVGACAAKSLNNLQFITNDNPSDGGVDENIAKELANYFNLPHLLIKRSNSETKKNDYEELAIATNAGRDLIRSRSSLDIAEKKYEKCSLILGGYGGEVMRAKYTNYKSLNDFIVRYFAGVRQLRALGKHESFLAKTSDKIHNEYMLNKQKQGSELFNWLYAMSKMRIWGGCRFAMMSQYGDSLHPFMDWHLLNPLIGWDFSNSDKTHLQKSLIEHFKPGAMKFPVNPTNTPQQAPNHILWQKISHRVKLLKHIVLPWPLSTIERNVNMHTKDKQLKALLQEKHRFNLRNFRRMGNPNYLTRYASIFIIKNILTK